MYTKKAKERGVVSVSRKKVIIRKRYREGQEGQLGVLGLAANALILWDTIYIQAALDHLRQQSILIYEEDEARF